VGLELRRGRDGQIRPHWYGRFDVDGRAKVVNLGVAVRGTPPVDGKVSGEGDRLFEASRAAAESALKQAKSEAQQKGRAEHLTERLIACKTGRKVEYARLEDLPSMWRNLGREAQPGEPWLKWCDTVFKRFAEAMPCEYLHEVTAEQVAIYVESLRRDFTRRTANGAASLLKSAFGRLLPLGMQNPFAVGITGKGNGADGEMIHRRPLTAEELVRLFEMARPDPLLYPLTVCAALTGLRIGDVCLLPWSAVDLRGGFVTVRTSKTGAVVEIPIFDPLQRVFESALADKELDVEFVWPDAAQMYKGNRYGIVYRGKALFARVFAGTDGNGAKRTADAPEQADLADILPEVCEAVKGAGFMDPKRDRILDSLERVAQGDSYRKIETETGRHRAQVSEDLHDAERVSGLTLRRGRPSKSGWAVRDLIGATRAERRGGAGKLSASVLGWHSLRATWATIALSVGIPVETVKLVTGHSTANTVLEFYHNPRREHLRAVLGEKLPSVLTGAVPRQIGAGRLAGLADRLKNLSVTDRAKLAKMMKT